MEEGKNEIMELRQMIEGCFERQNKLIARLEMELEALSNFNGKQMLDSRDMRLQLKVCDRTLIRWRMSGKLPSFKISGQGVLLGIRRVQVPPGGIWHGRPAGSPRRTGTNNN